ncbi:MAG: serine hydrolase [Xanthomonadaceae bacterium]|nr:serine hydrolase [Xanthomonadaceae bacterium]
MNFVVFVVLGFMGTQVQAQDSDLISLSQSLIQSKYSGVNTDAVLIYKDGQILFEHYARGYDSNKKHLSWSMAKTFAGILIGQAIEEGKLGLDDPISKFIPETQSKATIRNLLNMSSGIAFKEEYSGVPVDSDATKMLYMKGPKFGFGIYSAGLPNRKGAVAGEHFYYSIGDTNILMEILKRVSGTKSAYDELPFKKIFQPLGISQATFEQDAKGTFVGSSYVYLSAQDFLKFGQLLMNQGKVGNQEVIPSEYFKLMQALAPGVDKLALPGTSSQRAYSSQITTNRPIVGRGFNFPQYADLPEDSLIMIGHQGQWVIASPSEKLVIVRLGMDKGTSLDRYEFFAAVKTLIRDHQLTYTVPRDSNPTRYETHPSIPVSASKEKKEKGHLGDYFKVPHLIRAMAAKEYCSCINVIGRSESDCKSDLKVSLPLLPRLKVSKNGDVKATLGSGVFGRASKAKFISPELGCTLVQTR